MSEAFSDNNIHNVSGDNAQMNWAMEKARHTIGYFRESLQSPRPDQFGFTLKVRLEDENGIEHIWMNDLSVDSDGVFYGMVDAEPSIVKSVNFGAKIGIGIDNISDWLVIEQGRMIGGYTIRVYREGLSHDERAAFDHAMGLVIDYGVDYFAHDMSTPEGAVLCLEDAYTAGDLAAALACKDFLTEARMLLEQVPGMDASDDELIASTAETLKLAFEAHFNSGEIPNFDGVLRAFPERDFLDKDTVIISEICTHPDGRMSLDRLIVTKFGDEWRVGPPVNEAE